ncbi:MAG: DegV family EDD domain-containing protein [Lachnospiraceae bacterium]|nr:DegV family EDD domain-containing protein [Lachnospiraceae bacterium]
MNKVLASIFTPKKNPRYDEIKKYGIRDALRVSLVVFPVVSVAIILFIVMSFIWPESYSSGMMLMAYRKAWFIFLAGLILYEIILLLIDKHFEKHYRKMPVMNVLATLLILGWGCTMTYIDSISYGRVEVTLYMIVSFCIPFCLYLDTRIYLFLTAVSDAVIIYLFLRDGVDAAFNESNLGDFIVFIGIQIILGIVAFYFKFMVREQILEKEAQKDEIDQLNKSQNRFFSNMSHEIRTPINTIIGLNEMILRENVSPEINEDAENIQAASKMLLNLINDILDMSKFESGQMELNKVAYHTGDMLSDIVGMLWIRAKEKNLEFHVDVAPEIPSELFGDEMRIKQILINVLNNAIKYTSEGYVRLTMRCKRIDEKEAIITYSVSDSGMGIKKESMPYLFSAFKRVDEDKNRYIEGTGLGLSIVKQLVELMGGKISVNSVYTKGSTFVIEIPQRIVNDEYVGNISPGKKQKGGNDYRHVNAFEAPEARVLVVDDTTANLMVVEKLLKETKMQITTAPSGPEALKRTMEQSFHVILMDHKMPVMDGIECMHAIHDQMGGLCQDSKIIALTANAGKEIEALYEKEGFDGYLMKPVSGDELERVLYKFLPKELVTVTESSDSLIEESVAWISMHKKKVAVKITADSVADIPKALLKKFDIAILPHMVLTNDGIFKDGIEIETNGLLSYMEDPDVVAETISPEPEEHESFFSDQLDEAGSLVHIAISGKVARSSCPAAMEAAENFGNVTVIDSGHLSTGQGLMAIEASRLAQQGLDAEEIAVRMEKMRGCVHTSFIVDTLDFLARQDQVGKRTARLAKAFMIHPVVKLKKGEMKVSRVYFGSRENAWEKYVSSVFRVRGTIDTRMLFITYVGMTNQDLETVKDMALKKLKFDEIYFQKASPVIASNCGPGTFGLLFFTKYDE